MKRQAGLPRTVLERTPSPALGAHVPQASNPRESWGQGYPEAKTHSAAPPVMVR